MSPNVDDLKTSKYLSQKDIKKPVLVTIVGFNEVNFAREGDKPKMRWVLRLREFEKPFPLNPTNGELIQAITGSKEFSDWVGKKIVLYIDPTVSYGGTITGGVRCRAPKGQKTQPVDEPPVDEPEDFPQGFEEDYDIPREEEV